MALNDPLANALSKINNAEKIGKREVVIFPISKTIKEVLNIMKKEGYIGEYTESEDSKGASMILSLTGSINDCGAIKPRFSVKLDEYLKFEQRFLKAKDFGMIIVSTSKGLMTHIEAKSKNLGGSLISYCY
jgi:small subunit ribosomal protein S8